MLLVVEDVSTWTGATMPGYLAAGAAVTELAWRGHITPIGEGKSTWFQPTYMSPPRDEILAYVLDLMRLRSFDKRAGVLIGAIASSRTLILALRDRLLIKGVLRRETVQRFLVFWETMYPVDDPEPHRLLTARMADGIFGKRSVAFNDAAIITLAHAAGVLPHHFDSRLIKDHRQRLKDIAAGHAMPSGTGPFEADALKAAAVAALAIPGAASNMK